MAILTQDVYVSVEQKLCIAIVTHTDDVLSWL